jgi:hypothetical protein
MQSGTRPAIAQIVNGFLSRLSMTKRPWRGLSSTALMRPGTQRSGIAVSPRSWISSTLA